MLQLLGGNGLAGMIYACGGKRCVVAEKNDVLAYLEQCVQENLAVLEENGGTIKTVCMDGLEVAEVGG